MSLLEKFISTMSAGFVSSSPYEEEFLRLLIFLLVVARDIPLIYEPPVIQLTVQFIGGRFSSFGETSIASFVIFQFYRSRSASRSMMCPFFL